MTVFSWGASQHPYVNVLIGVLLVTPYAWFLFYFISRMLAERAIRSNKSAWEYLKPFRFPRPSSNGESTLRALNLINDWILQRTSTPSKIKREMKIGDKESVVVISSVELVLTPEHLSACDGFRSTVPELEPITRARGFLAADGAQLLVESSSDLGTSFKILFMNDSRWDEQMKNLYDPHDSFQKNSSLN